MEAARAVKLNAHAPYSGFAVGAVVEFDDGSVFTGCNVENSSYGLTMCAERVAIGAAVAAGQRAGGLKRVVVATDATPPSSPCGACRQVIAEFGDDVEVVSVGNGETRRWTIDELLPERFGGKDLER